MHGTETICTFGRANTFQTQIPPLFVLPRFISETRLAWKLCMDELLSWILMETVAAVATSTFLGGGNPIKVGRFTVFTPLCKCDQCDSVQV